MRQLLAAIMALVAALFMGSDPVAADHVPAAAPFTGRPTVGAVFAGSVQGSAHFCSGAVLSTSSEDLVITAAHCVTGNGSGILFVPGYDEGAEPFGEWRVAAVYAESAWLRSQDPRDDYVILRLAPRTVTGLLRRVEEVTGGFELSTAPRPGTVITVSGYNSGSDDDPISCSTRAGRLGIYPTFNCHNFVNGTSGSPWLVGRPGQERVVGVIGGLHQGGCTDVTSHSSPFGPAVLALQARAEAAGQGDTLPAPGASGC